MEQRQKEPLPRAERTSAPGQQDPFEKREWNAPGRTRGRLIESPASGPVGIVIFAPCVYRSRRDSWRRRFQVSAVEGHLARAGTYRGNCGRVRSQMQSRAERLHEAQPVERR